MTPLNDESPESVARAFVEAINHRSVEEIVALMTEDHVFIDGAGSRCVGREKMKAAWEAYFHLVPDYEVLVDETLADGNVVVLLGRAEGTYAVEGKLLEENRWQAPAAWRALIRETLVAEWRVYADNEPIRLLMAKHRG
jgi:ketosteroid isomerase-like protein